MERPSWFWKDLFDWLPGGCFVVDTAYRIVEVNAEICSMTGYRRDQLVGQPCNIICPKGPHRCPIFDGGRESINHDETAVRAADGRLVPILKNARRVSTDSGELIVEACTDITQQREAEESRERHEVLFQNLFGYTPVAGAIIDKSGRVVEVNPAFTELFGYTQEEISNRYIDELVLPPEMQSEGWEITRRVLNGQRPRTEGLRQHKDGSLFYAQIHSNPIRFRNEIIGVYAVYEDITHRKSREKELVTLAEKDPLTGVHNRRHGYNRLREQLLQARRKNNRVALLYIDLDNFKQVNDSYGHCVGDAVLVHVAGAIKDCLREKDILARVGGDEFVVFVEGNRSMQARQVAERIHQAFREPMEIDELQFHLDLSIGIALFPDHAESLDGLLHTADLAMYQAKRYGTPVEMACPRGSNDDTGERSH